MPLPENGRVGYEDDTAAPRIRLLCVAQDAPAGLHHPLRPPRGLAMHPPAVRDVFEEASLHVLREPCRVHRGQPSENGHRKVIGEHVARAGHPHKVQLPILFLELTDHRSIGPQIRLPVDVEDPPEARRVVDLQDARVRLRPWVLAAEFEHVLERGTVERRARAVVLPQPPGVDLAPLVVARFSLLFVGGALPLCCVGTLPRVANAVGKHVSGVDQAPLPAAAAAAHSITQRAHFRSPSGCAGRSPRRTGLDGFGRRARSFCAPRSPASELREPPGSPCEPGAWVRCARWSRQGR